MPTLPPRVVRVRAAYMFGADGSNGCPANSAKITDMPMCQDAAASILGVTSVTTETDGRYPSGCYSLSGSVYLNAHATGAGSSGSTPLCAGAHPRPATRAAAPWVVGRAG